MKKWDIKKICVLQLQQSTCTGVDTSTQVQQIPFQQEQ